MLDDHKHTERVPINLTEREFVDACREAQRLDMRPGEYIRLIFRQSMYGTVGMSRGNCNESKSAE